MYIEGFVCSHWQRDSRMVFQRTIPMVSSVCYIVTGRGGGAWFVWELYQRLLNYVTTDLDIPISVA